MLLFLLSLFGYLCAIMIGKWLLYPCHTSKECLLTDLMNWANYYQCSPNLLIGKFFYFQMSTFVTFNLIMSTASLYSFFVLLSTSCSARIAESTKGLDPNFMTLVCTPTSKHPSQQNSGQKLPESPISF